jgi:hypothetical protein
MPATTSEPGGGRDSSFGSPHLEDHKSGFERGEREREAGEGHHRFRLSDDNDVPQASLADRLRERQEQ